jgi:hypothetical protein
MVLITIIVPSLSRNNCRIKKWILTARQNPGGISVKYRLQALKSYCYSSGHQYRENTVFLNRCAQLKDNFYLSFYSIPLL